MIILFTGVIQKIFTSRHNIQYRKHPMAQLQQIISACLTKMNMDQQTFLQLIKALNIPIDNYIYDPNIFILLNEKLKSKLYDIIKSEGKNYIDYLRLPKFFVLKPQTKTKLIILLDAIWQQYSLLLTNQKEQLYYRETVNNMLPQFISLQDIQNYHLQNFAKFKLNKTNNHNPSQPLPNTHRNIIQHPNPYAIQPQPIQIDPLLTGFHRPVMGNPFYHAKIDSDYANGMGRLFGEGTPHLTAPWMEKTQPQSIMQQHMNNIIQSSHMNNFIDPNQPQNLSSNSIFPIPNSHQGVKQQNYQHSKSIQAQQQSPQQQKQTFTTYNKHLSSIQNNAPFSVAKSNNIQLGNHNYNKDSQKANNIRSSNNIIEQVEIEKRDQSQEQAKLVYITGDDDELSQKIRCYQFIQCPCQGIDKISTKKSNSNKSLIIQQSQYFECKLCHYYFHFECLNITDDTVKVDICPCCKLKQGSNIFVKIHPEAFGKRWCKMHIKQKLSMFLTEKEILKMKEFKQNVKSNSILQYQLRFLKIPNHAQKSTFNNQNKKTFQSNNSDLKKFNNLPLPSGYIEKIQPYNVFQISLRPAEVKGSGSTSEDEECLYIFGIFMIERYSEAQITEQLFSELNQNNSVGEEYLNRYLIDPVQGVEIKLTDPTSQQPIRYPVRGENCQHPQVFDCMSILQYYKEYGEKLSQQHCPICEVEYRKMVADRFLYGKLREISAVEHHPVYERARYLGASRVQFLCDQQEQDSQKQVSNNNDNNMMQQEGQQIGNNQQQQSQFNSGNNNDDRDNDDQDGSQSLSC